MERALNKLIEKSLKGVDVYQHKDSLWLIFTEQKRWVFEYTGEKILWYNYELFNTLFQFVSLDVTENTKYMTDWFIKNILTKPVEDTIQNGVKNTTGAEFTTNVVVENTIQNGVKLTYLDHRSKEELVEDTIQNGVSYTYAHPFPNDIDVDVEETIKNGIKGGIKITNTWFSPFNEIDKVDDVIENGIKDTFGMTRVNEEEINNTIQNGVLEIHDDASNNEARVNGVIKMGNKL